ncbi:MAG: DNA mismatch repair protein MutS [Clostridia bacterium]|nr:DNA mismatch repair protein MutS [Clostridia bacterium]
MKISDLTDEQLNKITPLMAQYIESKKEYNDCILLYRIGDFYEMFFEDAEIASQICELVLTGKDCGLDFRAPMCGMPFHSVESYIPRLVAKGYKVAICEQLEDASLAKGLVKRDVIRIITPGTVIETNMLDEKKNNYIAGVYKKGLSYGFAYSDVSTGEFYATEITSGNNFGKLLNEIAKTLPKELVINKEMFDDCNNFKNLKERFEVFSTVINLPEEIEKADSVSEYVSKNGGNNSALDEYLNESQKELMQNNTDSIKLKDKNTNLFQENRAPNNILNADDFDKLTKLKYASKAALALIKYIKETQKIDLTHINKINLYNVEKYMTLDSIARRNLELTETIRDRNKKGSLLWVLDKTSTSMGGRLLRKWVEEPLLDIDEINLRLDAVEELKDNLMLREEIKENLKKVYDIERLAGKIAYGTVNARELVTLKNSLSQIPALKALIKDAKSKELQIIYNEIDELKDIYKLIDDAIVDDPPISVKEGGIIKPTYSKEIGEYIMAARDGKQWVANLEAKERELTGIKNLKVGYNKVFGYYIEVSKGNVGNVPEDRYIRKQTLTTGERYITEELKNMEGIILGAQEKTIYLEYELFVKIRNEITKDIKRLQDTATAVATLDTLNSFADVAEENNYSKPTLTDDETIRISNGRHPVVEKLIPSGSFVPNDTLLDINENRINVITGPNMAGKSTYMRQVALICLMAQIGSFVSADDATIGIVDRIFTRVGASDDLSTGQSTFMVEMSEVANILNNATCKSLLILDEIGRGTSTYDGLSIAWSTVEYIANKEKIGARTLFATHYHELTELEDKVEGVKNYCIAVKEKGEDVIFLRKIIEGGADESYGVHVAKLAGIPNTVITRANKILKDLKEQNFVYEANNNKVKQEAVPTFGQMDLYNYRLGEIAEELEKVNLDELTPINALNILAKMKGKL